MVSHSQTLSLCFSFVSWIGLIIEMGPELLLQLEILAPCSSSLNHYSKAINPNNHVVVIQGTRYKSKSHIKTKASYFCKWTKNDGVFWSFWYIVCLLLWGDFIHTMIVNLSRLSLSNSKPIRIEKSSVHMYKGIVNTRLLALWHFTWHNRAEHQLVTNHVSRCHASLGRLQL